VAFRAIPIAHSGEERWSARITDYPLALAVYSSRGWYKVLDLPRKLLAQGMSIGTESLDGRVGNFPAFQIRESRRVHMSAFGEFSETQPLTFAFDSEGAERCRQFWVWFKRRIILAYRGPNAFYFGSAFGSATERARGRDPGLYLRRKVGDGPSLGRHCSWLRT
jgi:hypothetical protein